MKSFVPFDSLEVVDDSLNDFDVDEIAEWLGLNRTQRALLVYLLHDIDLQIWFEDEEPASISLNLFFQNSFVSKIDLFDMLETTFDEDNDNEIGITEEIAVLERLRDLVNAAIARKEKVRDS
jgi:hypothetical protein